MRAFFLVTALSVACAEPDPPIERATTDGPDRDCDVDGDGAEDLACGGADCDDTRDDVHPDAIERCDGIDNDCDARVDAADPDVDAPDWFADDDGDGWGGEPLGRACEPVAGAVPIGDDCDDDDDDVHPDAPEQCNDVDDDCDGSVDEPGGDIVATTWYEDGDGDGFGDPTVSLTACEAPPYWVDNGDDCDDLDASVTLVVDWALDADGDGFGDGSPPVASCTPPSPDHVVASLGVDCDDADPAAYPGAVEICGDAIDQDCDTFDAGCLGSGPLSAAGAIILGDVTNPASWIQSASPAGDFDGDGVPDIIVGVPTDATAMTGGGAAYVFSGATLTGTLQLSDAILTIEGRRVDEQLGWDLAALGDVDGDGLDDVLVGAANTALGLAGDAAYVIHGGTVGTISANSAPVRLIGAQLDDEAGSAVAGVGDVTGDGVPDMLVGAPSAMTAYLVDGTTTGIVSLSTATATLTGVTFGDIGAEVAAAGDVDGDGVRDLLIGANTMGRDVFLVHGAPAGVVDLPTAADATLKAEPGVYVGDRLADDVDLDGDGYADLVIGGSFATTYGGNLSGTVYVVMGPVAGLVKLGTADAIFHGDADDRAGQVTAPGDVDGDGAQDLLLGSWGWDGNRGRASLVLGPAVAGIARIEDAAAVHLEGDVIADWAGSRVASPGDVDRDGFSDLLVVAPGHDELGTQVGAAYLLFGDVL